MQMGMIFISSPKKRVNLHQFGRFNTDEDVIAHEKHKKIPFHDIDFNG